jgi:acetyltransferase-like isoleucine patch superfamily enzyme
MNLDLENRRTRLINLAHFAYWSRRLGGFERGQTRLDRPRMLTNPNRIYVGRDTYIRRGARLEVVPATWSTEPTGRIDIGRAVGIEDFCHIGAAEHVVIEDRVLIGSYVLIIDHDHTMSDDPNLGAFDGPLAVAPVRIGRGSWIGEGAKILKGVTIGERATVSAGAVVIRDVPAGATAVGVPARVL